ncbi:TetR family transcriptional regulator [Stigmatella sp. ncwal1]|uniref:TetR family transcriptional regulator n=1 Tax=Stigmatella ashevillensis TaxID=2995309 RepID=A0ABT5DKK9_9BACT|nr:TetR family transcriptional regulator [Stigmatella ashevillena]MDC0713660.1 TetR family transcriptional regulator [Stigmatella ashevillena]
MTLRLPSLLLCLLLGSPVWAATGLDVGRSAAQQARAAVRALRERQQTLRQELNGLAGHIETLKAERQGRLTPGQELEKALRRSQELSGELTGLAQAVASAEGESERAHLALHVALSEELSRTRAAWDATSDRNQRASLLSRMRELRAEREAVRSALPASRVPTVGRAEASDDPADLLEQADALRDSEDKVRQRLMALKSRIAEVREERELERRMSDFLGEERMFDEQDRRMRLRLNGTELSSQADEREGAHPGIVEPRDPPPSSVGGADPPSVPVNNGNPDAPSPPTTPAPVSVRASDHRPQVQGVRAQELAAGDFEDLATLEAEAKRLESLARELDSRANSLERKVRELE